MLSFTPGKHKCEVVSVKEKDGNTVACLSYNKNVHVEVLQGSVPITTGMLVEATVVVHGYIIYRPGGKFGWKEMHYGKEVRTFDETCDTLDEDKLFAILTKAKVPPKPSGVVLMKLTALEGEHAGTDIYTRSIEEAEPTSPNTEAADSTLYKV